MSTSCRCALLWAALGWATAATPPSYLIQTVAGSDFIGDFGPATQALLATVEGVVADQLGNYYLADTDAHRIRRISPNGTIVTIAGTGRPGYSGDGGPAVNAQLNLPYGMAVGPTGNLFVADFGNHCVRLITPAGIISTIANGFQGPRNLAADWSGNLFISDFIAGRVYQRTGQGVLTAIAGSAVSSSVGLGDGGTATLGHLSGPAGLAVDLTGNLWISDSGNKRIRRVAPTGIISSLDVPVSIPVGLAINFANELYIADAGAGELVRVTQPASDAPAIAHIGQPCRDVAVDYSGNLLVSYKNAVQLYNGSGFTLLAGGHDFYFAGDEGSAVTARLHDPQGLALDPAGNLYIADSANQRIRRLDAGGIIHTFVSTGLSFPRGLAFDPSAGNLYIADAGSHAILVASPAGTLSALISNGLGYSGDGGPAGLAQLNAPSAVAYDPAARILYIADQGNDRIRAITPDGIIQTVAQLKSPAGLAIHPKTAAVYAAESATGLIWTIQPNGGTRQLYSAAGVWIDPQGLAFDGDGNLLIADPGSKRITRIAVDGTVSLAAGVGAQGFSGDGGPGALAQLDTPMALAVDPTGVVYFSDSGNNRVRALTPVAGSLSTPATTDPLQLVTVVNAASRLPGPVTAGEWITILGTGLEASAIQIDSVPVDVIATKPGEITVAVPDSAAAAGGSIEIQALINGVPLARVTAQLAPDALGIFTGAILNEDGTPNSPENPALRGSVIVIPGTGDGRMGLTPGVTIDGQPMDLASFGPSPDAPGVFLLTAYVPSGYFPSGKHVLKLRGASSTSQPGVTISVH